jgi:serine/threonine protein kinase
VKVLDFGLAKQFQLVEADEQTRSVVAQATHAGTIIGTAAYMSPEQATGRPAEASFGSSHVMEPHPAVIFPGMLVWPGLRPMSSGWRMCRTSRDRAMSTYDRSPVLDRRDECRGAEARSLSGDAMGASCSTWLRMVR